MFGLFALGGDLGCTMGPTLIGMTSSVAGGDLRVGLMAACIFPILSVISMSLLIKRMKKVNI